MTELTAWFARQAARESRVPCLADALLANRFRPYAAYRLRYFFARYLASVVVHGIKVIFLYQLFSQRAFIAILVTYAAANLVTHFWWGALEEMRGRVRRLYRAGKPHMIGREIDRWLMLSFVLAALTLAAAIAWLAWRTIPRGRSFDVAQLYGFAVMLRLSIDFPVRTLHSGVYAIRRVYRPLWTLVGVEVVGILGFIIFAPLAGPWAFPLSTIAGTVAVAALAWHYTLRSYRFLGVEPFQRCALVLPMIRGRSGREMVAAGLSYALLKLDSFVVLGLFGAGAAYDRHELFLLFFLISPTIQAGFDWAQLFYFDLKRLDAGVYAHLRRRYERDILRLSWTLGFVFWALAVATGALFTMDTRASVYWLIGPFFISRSLLASVQIGAFSGRRYPELLGNALLWLTGFLVVAAAATDDRLRVAGLSAVTFVSYLALRTGQSRRARNVEERELRGLPEWLSEVSAIDEPIRIRWVSLARPIERSGDRRELARHHRWAHRQIADRIARRLGPHGAVAVPSGRRIAWYERKHVKRSISAQWLAATAGGFLELIGESGIQPAGAAALAAAAAAGLPHVGVPAAGQTLPPRDELRTVFRRMFSDGAAYAADRVAPTFFDGLSSNERRAIMADAVAFARDFRPSRRPQFDVTALCSEGALKWIFVVDRRVERTARARWRALVKAANVHASADPEAASGSSKTVGTPRTASVHPA